MDNSQRTRTGINVFQQCNIISICIHHLDRPWARDILITMKERGNNILTLSDEFLNICKENDITIPFFEINPDTYNDNIERLLQRSIRPEGNSHSVER
jgi:hypothetical protein